ncbi:MAG: galactose mutarotase [Clostridiales bacterium]|nr:galactose mutarotase [Clostridiales bacterium]
MSIQKNLFDTLPCGKQVERYTMTNASGASVSILNYGGIIQSIIVPNAAGEMADVTLGYPAIKGYIENPGYIGALIGRVGNRIADGRFTLNGIEYQLAKNENGVTHLHGGAVGFDKKIWDVTPVEGIKADHLILKYVSADGEENYPGELTVMVTYSFDDDCALSIRYEAVSTKDTPVSLTNHAYFNLAGEGSGSIIDHKIQIAADCFTVVDSKCIPTGESRPVDGTPFDLRALRRIGDDIDANDEQIGFGAGYDHNFVLNGEGMRNCVVLHAAGRVMTVSTDMPCIQFYAGNMLATEEVGKCGRPYGKREGLCLETQYTPDAINHPEFGCAVLAAGKKYEFTTVYKFNTCEE